MGKRWPAECTAATATATGSTACSATTATTAASSSTCPTTTATAATGSSTRPTATAETAGWNKAKPDGRKVERKILLHESPADEKKVYDDAEQKAVQNYLKQGNNEQTALTKASMDAGAAVIRYRQKKGRPTNG